MVLQNTSEPIESLEKVTAFLLDGAIERSATNLCNPEKLVANLPVGDSLPLPLP
ncbi:MAG: hypothetical protein KME16_09770 [Scytolyngbya sp. HA4215-MV1]|jgi:hypothetical protein|nr:hypothetical protein [Scytolyngbya sp. HA4215-MV1]